MRIRRVIGVLIVVAGVAVWWLQHYDILSKTDAANFTPIESSTTSTRAVDPNSKKARDILDSLTVKGRAPKTGYTRTQFGNGWTSTGKCDTRNIILNRDLVNPKVNDLCKVQSGTLRDPYTGATINFVRGAKSSEAVQIDHVVALSNAWQTGAQQLDSATRVALANDPLELLAIDGKANQTKGDGDAATWLPSNKAFRCQYVARQIAVKSKYRLWVTYAEKSAMQNVLAHCPDEAVPSQQD